MRRKTSSLINRQNIEGLGGSQKPQIFNFILNAIDI